MHTSPQGGNAQNSINHSFAHVFSGGGCAFLIYQLLTIINVVLCISPMGGSAHFLTYQLLTVINVVLHTSTLGGFAQLVATDEATTCNQLPSVQLQSIQKPKFL